MTKSGILLLLLITFNTYSNDLILIDCPNTNVTVNQWGNSYKEIAIENDFNLPTNERNPYINRVIVNKDLVFYITSIFCSDSQYTSNGKDVLRKKYQYALVSNNFDYRALRYANTKYSLIHDQPPVEECVPLIKKITDSDSLKMSQLSGLGDSLSFYHPLEYYTLRYYDGSEISGGWGGNNKIENSNDLIFINTNNASYKIQIRDIDTDEFEFLVSVDTSGKGHFPPYPENIASLLPSMSISLDFWKDTSITVVTSDTTVGGSLGNSISDELLKKIKGQPINYALIINSDTLLIADVIDVEAPMMLGSYSNYSKCMLSLDEQINAQTLKDTVWESTLASEKLVGWEYQQGFSYDTLHKFYNPISFSLNIQPYGNVVKDWGAMGGEFYRDWWYNTVKTVWYISTPSQVIKLQLNKVYGNNKDTFDFTIASLPSDVTANKTNNSFKLNKNNAYYCNNLLWIPKQIKSDKVSVHNLSGKCVYNSKLVDGVEYVSMENKASGYYLYKFFNKNKLVGRGSFLIR